MERGQQEVIGRLVVGWGGLGVTSMLHGPDEVLIDEGYPSAGHLTPSVLRRSAL